MISSLGRMRWQEIAGCGRRALDETTMGRYEVLIGERLRCRGDASRRTEAVVGSARFSIACSLLQSPTPCGVRRAQSKPLTPEAGPRPHCLGAPTPCTCAPMKLSGRSNSARRRSHCGIPDSHSRVGLPEIRAATIYTQTEITPTSRTFPIAASTLPGLRFAGSARPARRVCRRQRFDRRRTTGSCIRGVEPPRRQGPT